MKCFYCVPGQLLREVGRYDEAMTDYNKRSIEFKCRVCADAYYNRGELNQILKDYAAAMADYNKAAVGAAERGSEIGSVLKGTTKASNLALMAARFYDQTSRNTAKAGYTEVTMELEELQKNLESVGDAIGRAAASLDEIGGGCCCCR